jgi:hypothetical protein
MPFGSRFEDEPAIAIGALHKISIAHLKIDFGMAERSANAFASDLGVLDFDNFGSINRHGLHFLRGAEWIISTRFAPASALRGASRRDSL